MFEDLIRAFVHDHLGAAHREVEFLCQPFKGDAIEQPPGQDFAIPLRVGADKPFVHEALDVAPTEIRDGHFRATRPVPLQFGHSFVGFLELVFFTRNFTTCLTLAIEGYAPFSRG